MEGNDTHGGHGRVCEGDRARVGVSHEMVEVKLLCFRWLSLFLKLVKKGFPRFAEDQTIFSFDVVWVHPHNINSSFVMPIFIEHSAVL